MPSFEDAGLAFFSLVSFISDPAVTPDPVVALPLGCAFMVPRAGTPLVLPVSEAVDGSVGEGVVALTPPPEVLAGAGELWAKARPVAVVSRVVARTRVQIFMKMPFGLLDLLVDARCELETTL
jgi:hypothetical protein